MSSETKKHDDDAEPGAMDRRDFLAKLAAITGGAAAAAVIVPSLDGAAQAGPLVPPDDPRLETGYVKYPIEGGEMRAYSAKPKGAGKLAGEGYCSAFWRSYGLRTVPLRFANVYGPYSYHKGSVVAKFFRQILAQDELTVFGDGRQTRDFLYVEDLCAAILKAVAVEVPFGQPIQLGSGQETSINHLLELLRATVRPRVFPPVQYVPARSGEVRRNYVSIARASKYLQFTLRTPLPENLRQTWEWFQALDATRWSG